MTLTTNLGTFKRHYTGVGLFQSLQPVHFGLGSETQIESLKILWPSGLEETFQDLDADLTIKAIEGQGYTVLDILPSQKIYGCLDASSCTYNPLATLDDGSCTYVEAQIISGATSSGFFKTETYSYPILSNSTANWTVVGGEILSGQSTSSIEVKWGLNETGSITVRESNGTCFSQPQNISIVLSAANIPDDVSIARLWNEILLEAIRNDFARPTVHARNLFHLSVAMYDIWAIYDGLAEPYLIGNTLNNFNSDLETFVPSESVELSTNKAISFAMYRLLSYRFQNSPNAESIQQLFDFSHGGNWDITRLPPQFCTSLETPRHLVILWQKQSSEYGNTDGSRELTEFDNGFYQSVNDPLTPNVTNASLMNDPNRWQPLSLTRILTKAET